MLASVSACVCLGKVPATRQGKQQVEYQTAFCILTSMICFPS